MTKTDVKLLWKAQAVELKAYAVAGTIKERVEWCSQHTDYIRANRPSYYVSDAQRTKILNAVEVRNELARINLLKNTRYKPTRYNISFNYIANPPLQKKIEDMQGRIQFDLGTPMVPPYGRIRITSNPNRNRRQCTDITLAAEIKRKVNILKSLTNLSVGRRK